MINLKPINLSCSNLSYIIANDQFSDKFNNGGALLLNVLLFYYEMYMFFFEN